MKRLIITGLLAFLITTTFLSDNPPGWFQQTLPLSNVTVQDIFFIDSLKGWVSAMKNSTNDTAYIFFTSDGGNSWTIQFKDSIRWINVVQFLDENTGYAGGGFGDPKFLKTTNGGNNWQVGTPSGLTNYSILDMEFVNKDTGWVCSDESLDGGIFKTTNGGSSWQRQTTASKLRPIKLFFLNNDTGWALSEGKISKTINGGNTWSFLNGVSGIERDLFFLNNDTGWVICGGSGQNGITKTTNGGANWFVQLDPTPFGSAPNKIFIINNSKGWIASGFFTILSLANDSTWGKQSVPSGFPGFNSIQMLDTNIGYSGGTIFVKTEDGGGIITGTKENSEIVSDRFTLYQNYPNPFNPVTIISYELRVKSIIALKVFDMQGKEIKTLFNSQQNAGNYKIEFDGSELSSGVYFYRIEGKEQSTGRSFLETKNMILIR